MTLCTNPSSARSFSVMSSKDEIQLFLEMHVIEWFAQACG
jgi:hypothetical protein